MIFVFIYILSASWIGYRVFVDKQFLIWTWTQGGPVRYMWNEDRWDGHEG